MSQVGSKWFNDFGIRQVYIINHFLYGSPVYFSVMPFLLHEYSLLLPRLLNVANSIDAIFIGHIKLHSDLRKMQLSCKITILQVLGVINFNLIENQLQNNKYLYIDYLRVCAALLVICVHVTGPFMQIYFEKDSAVWWISNIIGSVARCSVPLFIMISGTLLLSKKNNNQKLRVFLKKRFSKILPSFIFWSSVYFVWKYTYSRTYTNYEFVSIGQTIIDFLQANSYYHLWFIYMIIGLYIFTPIIRLILNHINNEILNYLIAVWVIATPINNLLINFFNIKIGINLEFMAGYVGLYILGYILNNITIDKISHIKIHTLGVLGILFTLFGNYFSFIPEHTQKFSYFYSYLSLNVIFMSVSFFVLAKSIIEDYIVPSSKFLKCTKLVEFISSTSLGVYFVHVLILEIIFNIFERYYSTFYIGHPLSTLFIIILLVAFVSQAIVYLLSKMPLLKKFV